MTSFWIKVESTLGEKPTPKILVKLKAYRSETDHDAGYNNLQLEDTGAGLATDVPSQLSNLNDDLTPAQYANVDMTTIHNKVRDLLIQGDSHAQWSNYFGDLIWAGFGVGNVSRIMPS